MEKRIKSDGRGRTNFPSAHEGEIQTNHSRKNEVIHENHRSQDCRNPKENGTDGEE